MRPDVSRLLQAVEEGDSPRSSELFPLVYGELRRLAQKHLAAEAAGHTLQATALVHDAFIRLLGPDGVDAEWSGRAHFFGAVAESMRRILIDHARGKKTQKRGGDVVRVTFDDTVVSREFDPDEFLGFDDALNKLEQSDPRKAEIVRLRFYAGLTTRQVAGVMGLPRSTVSDQWVIARAWLLRELFDR